MYLFLKSITLPPWTSSEALPYRTWFGKFPSHPLQKDWPTSWRTTAKSTQFALEGQASRISNTEPWSGCGPKREKSDLHVVWLELANAYGSVPHSLIDFALEFFYTPRSVITIHSSWLHLRSSSVERGKWLQSGGWFPALELRWIIWQASCSFMYSKTPQGPRWAYQVGKDEDQACKVLESFNQERCEER